MSLVPYSIRAHVRLSDEMGKDDPDHQGRSLALILEADGRSCEARGYWIDPADPNDPWLPRACEILAEEKAS